MDKKNINTRDLLQTLDGIAEKIPEKVARILKYIAIAIFFILLVSYGYSGWQKGLSMAEPEGQKIAEDTKSLFYEDLEKNYNRKKKNIRFHEMNTGMETTFEKEYEFYTEKPDTGISRELTNPLEEEKSKRGNIVDTIQDSDKMVSDPAVIPGKMTAEDEAAISEHSNEDVLKPQKAKPEKGSERKRKLLMPGE